MKFPDWFSVLSNSSGCAIIEIMESGFEKASSDNLPIIDVSMIDEYYTDNIQFLSAEMKNVKTQR